jgi:3-oxoacyl-[acyl-carrier protein] reductase
MELNGLNALVSGGDKGIGKAVVFALAKKGANVAFSFFSEKGKAEDTLGQLKKYNVKAVMVQADVRNYQQVEDMVEQVKKKLGRIDILVNNAGTSGLNSALEKISIEDWNTVIGINLSGVFNCCKAAQSELVKNKGKIVNMSSIAGKMGGTIGSHYAASKAGVIGLTFALARELAPRVTVNAIAPGPVDTELLSTEVKNILSKATPFGRIAKPEEIAHTVIYLLENDYVSGEVININAGRYMN